MASWVWIIAVGALALSWNRDRDRTKVALKKSLSSLKGMLGPVLSMIAAVGLILAIFPESVLMKIFNVSGVGGLIFASTIGAIVNIPGPIAFPLAGSLLKMGVRPAILASFITTLTMVGLVTLPLESSAFGKRFTLARQSLSFLSAVTIGLLMGALL